MWAPQLNWEKNNNQLATVKIPGFQLSRTNTQLFQNSFFN